MSTLRDFDATQHEPVASREPMPVGEYEVAIVSSETKPTRANSGSYLELVFAVLVGPFKGRQLRTRLNLENPSEQAVVIAQRELSAICHAVGIMKPEDSNKLHEIPMLVSVAREPRTDGSGLFDNRIAAYSPLSSESLRES